MRYQLADGVTTVKFASGPRPDRAARRRRGARDRVSLAAGRETLGHRFMSNGPVAIPDADAYAATLADKGRVMASFEGRRADIERQLLDHAGRPATLGDDPEVAALLDEVTALVEHPTVYVGEFEEQFLQVPQECLILTMRLKPEVLPAFDPASGRLTHRFLIVSNMHTANPVNIVEGNQRVRPRLADAQFFNTDRKTPLAARRAAGRYRLPQRWAPSSTRRARARHRPGRGAAAGRRRRPPTAPPCWPRPTWARTWWASSPSCGIMGAYYAAGDGEPASVVEALRTQYRNRCDAPVNADTLTAATLFIAERAETLVGIWAIGLAPTGERDPSACAAPRWA